MQDIKIAITIRAAGVCSFQRAFRPHDTAMAHTHGPTDLDKLLLECQAAKDDTTMTISGNLEDWEIHSNFQYKRSENQNTLLAKIVEKQNEDDKNRWLVNALAWFTTKVGAAVAIGLFAAVTYGTTEIAKAYFTETPEEKARQELLDNMLKEKFGHTGHEPDSKK